jgi:hypothetical protein
VSPFLQELIEFLRLTLIGIIVTGMLLFSQEGELLVILKLGISEAVCPTAACLR